MKSLRIAVLLAPDGIRSVNADHSAVGFLCTGLIKSTVNGYLLTTHFNLLIFRFDIHLFKVIIQNVRKDAYQKGL